MTRPSFLLRLALSLGLALLAVATPPIRNAALAGIADPAQIAGGGEATEFFPSPSLRFTLRIVL